MAFKRIEDADLTNKGVVGQENTPNLSAREMQEKVEEIPRKVIIPIFNALVDALNKGTGSDGITVTVPSGVPAETANNLNAVLAALGAELLKRVISDDVKKIRLNSFGELEVSTDGKNFSIASSRGHTILDETFSQFPQRRKLRFENTLVEDDETQDTTVIYGGKQGPPGPQGPGGVVTDLSPGFFGMTVDDDGNLILHHNDGELAPPFSLDEDYNLIYTISDGVVLNLGSVRGQTGPAAGFGSITASATSLAAGAQPTAEVEASGDDTAKNLTFRFGIPRAEASEETGGYYSPKVTQTAENTMQVSYTASKAGMPAVEPVTVTLPDGPAGPAAGFGVISAEALALASDQKPYVNLEAVGPDTEKAMAFFFGIPRGKDGTTPQKGVDYWTMEDRQQMVQDVVDSLPVYNGEVMDIG